MASYEDLLSKTYDELPEDLLIPNGTWRQRIQSVTFQKPKTPDGQAKWFVVTIAKEAMDDVDMDAVAADFPDGDFSQSELFTTFWMRKPSDLTKMVRWMATAGIVLEKPYSIGKVNEHLKELKGKEILGLVGTKLRTDNDGTSSLENTVSKWAPVEE